MKVAGCYANCINECNGDLTKEHIISKALLGAEISAIINGNEKIFSKKDFVVRNLCKHHNNSFRKMESHMRHFTDFIVNDADLYRSVQSSPAVQDLNLPQKFKVKGKYLENWLLKLSINYFYMMKDFQQPNFNYDFIAKGLFNELSFEEPFGLSVIKSSEQISHKHPGEIVFEPRKDVNGEICGMVMNLQGHLFLIWLPTSNSHRLTREGLLFKNKVYKYGESIIWHDVGIRQQMFAGDGSVVTRSELLIKWNK